MCVVDQLGICGISRQKRIETEVVEGLTTRTVIDQSLGVIIARSTRDLGAAAVHATRLAHMAVSHERRPNSDRLSPMSPYVFICARARSSAAPIEASLESSTA
jgi:hypothetical protein